MSETGRRGFMGALAGLFAGKAVKPRKVESLCIPFTVEMPEVELKVKPSEHVPSGSVLYVRNGELHWRTANGQDVVLDDGRQDDDSVDVVFEEVCS